MRLVTLGCARNEVDSEELAARLEVGGWELTQDDHPDVVRRFLAAWFETQTYMKTHKADAVAEIVKRLQIPDAVASADFDTLMPDFSKDGKFSPAALNVLSQSFIQMGSLPAVPDMSKLYTEAYLPPAGK